MCARVCVCVTLAVGGWQAGCLWLYVHSNSARPGRRLYMHGTANENIYIAVWDITSPFIVLVWTWQHMQTCVFMCLSVRTSVCRDRHRNRLYSVTRYSWHANKALETIRVNNIQHTGEACSDSPASPLWFDKIVLATTSRRPILQTVTYCSGNCRGERVGQINLVLILHLAQYIYSTARKGVGMKEGRGWNKRDGEWDVWRKVGSRVFSWKLSTPPGHCIES